MKNTFGNSLAVTLFGESHGEAIGAVIDGLPAGIKVDEDFIKSQLSMRRPYGKISTTRHEADEFKIVSGVFKGVTCGTPLCIVIENRDTKSEDYPDGMNIPRPSHADYSAHIKYGGNEDFRGGGHFSGRITAAVVAAAAIVIPALNKKGIEIGTHLCRIGGIDDRKFDDINEDIKSLNSMIFAVLDGEKSKKMQKEIEAANAKGDSVGGITETAVSGLPAGLGEPFFDSTESLLSHTLFSIPAVKGVEFGAGFDICDMAGSAANDAFGIKDGKVITFTNNSGGINGGITNGMPIIFRCAFKPTPTISITQKSVNLAQNCETVLNMTGRHDPCIVHRARVVVDSITALTVSDMLLSHFGADFFVK